MKQCLVKHSVEQDLEVLCVCMCVHVCVHACVLACVCSTLNWYSDRSDVYGVNGDVHVHHALSVHITHSVQQYLDIVETHGYMQECRMRWLLSGVM